MKEKTDQKDEGKERPKRLMKEKTDQKDEGKERPKRRKREAKKRRKRERPKRWMNTKTISMFCFWQKEREAKKRKEKREAKKINEGKERGQKMKEGKEWPKKMNSDQDNFNNILDQGAIALFNDITGIIMMQHHKRENGLLEGREILKKELWEMFCLALNIAFILLVLYHRILFIGFISKNSFYWLSTTRVLLSVFCVLAIIQSSCNSMNIQWPWLLMLVQVTLFRALVIQLTNNDHDFNEKNLGLSENG